MTSFTAQQIRDASAYQLTPLELALAPAIWRRKLLASTTFGIEMRGVSIILEHDWDNAASRVNPKVGTGHPLLDEFFASRFSPMTTKWIHHHPELAKVEKLFDRYALIMRDKFDFAHPKYAPFVKRPC